MNIGEKEVLNRIKRKGEKELKKNIRRKSLLLAYVMLEQGNTRKAGEAIRVYKKLEEKKSKRF